jgi:hypothetical protein
MSEALIGVVIGGLLSGLGTWITVAVQHKRWSTELRANRLQAKREKLEEASTRILDELPGAMAERSYPSKMTSEIDILFPENVTRAFNAMMSEQDKSQLKMKHHYYAIALAMRKSLRDIDEEIDVIVFREGISFRKAK